MLSTVQLKGVRFFAALEQAHLDAVGALAQEERYPKGAVLFAEGDTGDKFFFLLKGKVRISQIVDGVGEEALAILEEGDYFGEMALILGVPRSAHAIAHTDVIVASIDREVFTHLISSNRELGFHVLWSFVLTLSERLRSTDQKLKTFITMLGRF